VVARADVSFADPIEVNPPTPVGADSAVVTGNVPEIGAQVNAGDVLIEISGRPVFVLPGAFPTYRTLGQGSAGPDVQQLRAALNKLGIKAGPSSKTYDAVLADAVQKLYTRSGYPPPGSDDLSLAKGVRDARDALTEAKEAKTQAQQEYNAAKSASPSDDGTTSQLELAALKQMVTVAGRAVTRAQEALSDAQRAAWTTMPAGEVIFVSKLPRRVDSVDAAVGQVLIGGGGERAAIVLSGANIGIVAHVPGVYAELIEKGEKAVLSASDGTEYQATVKSACVEPRASTVCDTKLSLDDPLGANREALVGNIRVSIAVGTSSVDALVVPVAAVSANPGGHAQVQRVTGGLLHDRSPDQQMTTMITVKTGLSAEGYVEIEPADGGIDVGDLVVLGVASQATPSAEPTGR
jgi:hypothetical protein